MTYHPSMSERSAPGRRTPRLEPLWTLNHGPRRLHAALCDRGGLGVELQIRQNGDFFSGRRFKLRRHALAFSDLLRESFEADGWRRDQRPPMS
jgi:hypothetical protein